MSKLIRLYKYTSIPSALKILSTGRFAFRHPKFFNDPFDGHISDVTQFDGEMFQQRFYEEAKELIVDCSRVITAADPSITELIKKCRAIAKRSISEALTEFKEETIDSIGSVVKAGIETFTDSKWLEAMTTMRMLCLSEVKDSVLMWSHYSDSHRGAVIEIDVPIKRFEQVEYQKSFPTDIQPAICWAKKQFGTNQRDIDKILKSQLATKSHWWEYEKEWRSIITAGEDRADPHFAEIGMITGVYIGCNSSPIDRIAIQNIVEALHPAVKIFAGEVEKYNYGLKFEEIIYSATT